MTSEEKTKITDIKKCNFTEILEYFKKKSEERKAMSKEEKQVRYNNFHIHLFIWYFPSNK